VGGWVVAMGGVPPGWWGEYGAVEWVWGAWKEVGAQGVGLVFEPCVAEDGDGHAAVHSTPSVFDVG
jgi:hypothetical protein